MVTVGREGGIKLSSLDGLELVCNNEPPVAAVYQLNVLASVALAKSGKTLPPQAEPGITLLGEPGIVFTVAVIGLRMLSVHLPVNVT